jgi:hypothetical protein
MIKYPFPIIGLQDAEIDIFLQTFNKLESVFDAGFNKNFNLDTERFESLKAYSTSVREAVQIGNKTHIAFMHVHYTYTGTKGARMSAAEFQAWGFVELKNNFGHVFIKREGFTEKFVELLKPVELDFEEDAAFSSKFFVLAKDKPKALRAMSPSFRNALLNFNMTSFTMEIVGNTLLIGNNKCMDAEDAFEIARFIHTIAAIK